MTKQQELFTLNTPKFEKEIIKLGLDYNDHTYFGVEQLFSMQAHLEVEAEDATGELTEELISRQVAQVKFSVDKLIGILVEADVSYKIVSKLIQIQEEYIYQYTEGVDTQDLKNLTWENTTVGDFNRFKDKVHLDEDDIYVIQAVVYETGNVEEIHEILQTMLYGL